MWIIFNILFIFELVKNGIVSFCVLLVDVTKCENSLFKKSNKIKKLNVCLTASARVVV